MYKLFSIYLVSSFFSVFIPCDSLLQNNFYWNSFTKGFKSQARNFFIKRAEKKGIPWNDLKHKYQNPTSFQTIEKQFQNLRNLSILYPSYFLQPFHGYDDGNMNWDAAFENEASTMSISSNYWEDIIPKDAARRMRSTFHDSIKEYRKVKYRKVKYRKVKYRKVKHRKVKHRKVKQRKVKHRKVKQRKVKHHKVSNHDISILDVGCSVGISTTFLREAFPNCHIEGIDLSPYFLAIASFNARHSKTLSFSHQNAEFTNFQDKKFDLVCSSFLFHELPKTARLAILKEIFRILKPEGTIAILDLNPLILKEKLSKNKLRKLFFESTEPHIFDYYQCDLIEELKTIGFTNVKAITNDPFNSVWLASK